MKKVRLFYAALLTLWLLIGTNAAQAQNLSVGGTSSVSPTIAPISFTTNDPNNPNTLVTFHFEAKFSAPQTTHPGETLSAPNIRWTFVVQYKPTKADTFTTADPATYAMQSESAPASKSDDLNYWFYAAGYWQVVASVAVSYTGTYPTDPAGVEINPIADFFGSTGGAPDPTDDLFGVRWFWLAPKEIVGVSHPGGVEVWSGSLLLIAGVHDAVKVKSVQYQATDNSVAPPVTSWVDVPSTLYVLKGTTLTFQALPLAPDTDFPPGKPTWGGTAGASGVGVTKTVTFSTTSANQLDFKTVTVTCANTASFNVIVYDISPAPAPVDNFTGRDEGTYGVGEVVSLYALVFPLDVIIPVSVGWSATGANSVVDGGTLYVGDVNQTGSVTLTLTVQSGPSAGQTRTSMKAVTAPTGLNYTTTLADVMHHMGVIDSGFRGRVYLMPATVSFHNCAVQEQNCLPSIASGCFTAMTTYPHGGYKPNTTTLADLPISRIASGNAATGCFLGIDVVYSGGVLPAAQPQSPDNVGELRYDMSWSYQVISGQNGRSTNMKPFVSLVQRSVSDVNGTVTTSKSNASSTSAVGDPTSNF